MEKIVFLDRDGTINEEVNYLHRTEDLKFLPGVPEALRLLKEAGFKLVVVTNQAGVARGYHTCADVEHLHASMNEELKKYGAEIDAFYYCPHHPVHGIGIYKKVCQCRKPGTGMFLQAEERFRIDKAHSGILVGTGYGADINREIKEKGEKPLYDFYAETLMDAARYIRAREGKTASAV